MPRVLVAILNWNRTPETLRCLEAALSMDYTNFAVLVIDNGSRVAPTESMATWARERAVALRTLNAREHCDELAHKEVALLQCAENTGYSGGNNRALQLGLALKYDWILILNNDTQVPPDFLSQMVAAGISSDRVGLVGCRVLDPATKAYNGGDLLYWFGVYALHRWQRRTGWGPTNFVPGCSALVRSEMVAQIGLFDERYFLYTEDVDYSYRALKSGWKLIINLNTEVVHGPSGSIGPGGRNSYYYYYVTRNTLRFIAGRLSIWARPLSAALFISQMLARCVLWSLTRNTKHVYATWLGLRDFVLGRSGSAPEALSR